MSQKILNTILLIAVVAILGWLLYWQFNLHYESPPGEVAHHKLVTNVTTTPVTQHVVVVVAAPAPEPEAAPPPPVVKEATNQPASTPEPPPVQQPEPTPPPPPPAEPEKPAVAAPSIQGGVIHGKVFFRGDVPKQKKIQTDADPKCAEMHADEPLLDETVIVNDNSTLRNVFVYIVGGLENVTAETPTDAVVLEQRGCRYEPHVFGLQVKQPLVIRNSDDTLHNIHAVPLNPANNELNVGQPNKGMETKRSFAAREVMIHFKCDVHPWMSAYVGVLDHPYFAVTGADGAFALPPLPVGQYVVAAWHEVYGMLTQMVTLGEKETREINFAFKP